MDSPEFTPESNRSRREPAPDLKPQFQQTLHDTSVPLSPQTRGRRVRLRRRRQRRQAPERQAQGRAVLPVWSALAGAAAGSGHLSCRMCGRRRRRRAGPGDRGAAWLRCQDSRPRPLPTGPRYLAIGTPRSARTGTASEPRLSVYFGSSGISCPFIRSLLQGCSLYLILLT